MGHLQSSKLPVFLKQSGNFDGLIFPELSTAATGPIAIGTVVTGRKTRNKNILAEFLDRE